MTPLFANRWLTATYAPPEEYKADADAEILILDRYAPTAVMRRLAETGTGLLELADDLPEQFRRLQTMLDTGGPEVHLRADEFEPLVDRVGVAGQRFGAALIGAGGHVDRRRDADLVVADQA
jgi:hypothetical protein